MVGSIRKDDASDLARILKQLSKRAPVITRNVLGGILREPSILVLAMRDEKGKIIGTGTLIVVKTFMGKVARLEDIVVDEAYRGQGLGRVLVKELMARAKKEGTKKMELTSGHHRLSANLLYKKLGFSQVDTNVYRFLK